MKSLNKLFALILVFAFSVSLFSHSAIAEPDNDELLALPETVLTVADLPQTLSLEVAQEAGLVERQRSEESELDTAIFRKADGSNAMYIFNENIKYIDENGTAKDKTNRLTFTQNGYTNLDNDVRVLYPQSISTGISVSYDEYNINMIPVCAQTPIGSAQLNESDIHAVSDSVRYNGVFGSTTDIVYTQNLSGFKEEIILTQPSNTTRFSFLLQTDGLKLVESGNKLLLIDPADESEFAEIGSVKMWDSNGVYGSGSYIVETAKENSVYGITIVADDFLANENLQYPVTVDPSMTILSTDGLGFYDMTIFNNYSTNFGQWFTLFIGNYDEYAPNFPERGVARTYVKFPGLISNTSFRNKYSDGKVTSVKFNFSDNTCTSNTIYAYLTTMTWGEASSVYSENLWNAHGFYLGKTDITERSGITVPYPRYDIDITLAVDCWLDEESPITNYGIMLKAADETKAATVIGAREAGDYGVGGRSDSRPYLVVNYSDNLDGIVYKIRNVGSGKYLTVHNGFDNRSSTAHRNVYQYSKYTNDKFFERGQEFLIDYDSSQSAYRIKAFCSRSGMNKCLDIVKNGSGAAGLKSGCNVQTCKPVDDIAELFNIVATGTGSYKITLKHAPDLALTACGTGNGTNDGRSGTSQGNVFISTYTGASNQCWIFERSDESTKQYYYYSAMDLMYPVSSTGTKRSASGYGHRAYPSESSCDDHCGVDITANQNTSLVSMFDGRNIESNDTLIGDRGFYIIVEATDDCYSVYKSIQKLRFVYMHMNEAATATMAANGVTSNSIKKGDVIGKVGKTGDTNAFHLHLGIITGGTTQAGIDDTIDPMLFFQQLTFDFADQP